MRKLAESMNLSTEYGGPYVSSITFTYSILEDIYMLAFSIMSKKRVKEMELYPPYEREREVEYFANRISPYEHQKVFLIRIAEDKCYSQRVE